MMTTCFAFLNFAIVAGCETGKLLIAAAPDSDLYKVIEGVAYSLAWRPNPALQTRVDGIIDTIASAQAGDGYLNTQYMLPLDHLRLRARRTTGAS